MDRPLEIDRIVGETFIVQAEHHPTLGSTNDRARERAARGITGLPLLVVADRQTAGRGRGDKRWWTGAGGLALSLLVEADAVAAGRSRSPLVALATAVAVVETVAPLLPAREVGIRWPNDVLAAGRKLAGILVEVLPDRKHVIGVGLNTNNTLADAPAELQATMATLRDLSGRRARSNGHSHRPLAALSTASSSTCEPVCRTLPPGPTPCVCSAGRTVTLEQGNRTITGRCQGIAPDGALLLETAKGVETVYSGVAL